MGHRKVNWKKQNVSCFNYSDWFSQLPVAHKWERNRLISAIEYLIFQGYFYHPLTMTKKSFPMCFNYIKGLHFKQNDRTQKDKLRKTYITEVTQKRHVMR